MRDKQGKAGVLGNKCSSHRWRLNAPAKATEAGDMYNRRRALSHRYIHTSNATEATPAHAVSLPTLYHLPACLA